jgi:hypothetical protein
MENRFVPPNERLGAHRLSDLDLTALSVYTPF